MTTASGAGANGTGGGTVVAEKVALPPSNVTVSCACNCGEVTNTHTAAKTKIALDRMVMSKAPCSLRKRTCPIEKTSLRCPSTRAPKQGLSTPGSSTAGSQTAEHSGKHHHCQRTGLRNRGKAVRKFVKRRNRIEVPGGDRPSECERCLLYTSPSPRDKRQSRMPSTA